MASGSGQVQPDRPVAGILVGAGHTSAAGSLAKAKHKLAQASHNLAGRPVAGLQRSMGPEHIPFTEEVDK